MKTFGYARVSTKKQDLSVPAQIERIEKYCDLNGMELVEIFSEKESAKDMRSRPEFQKMLSLFKAKQAEALVVAKFDRFARNTVEALTLSEELEANGIALHSINERIDTKSATGKLFFTILNALGEFELSRGVERTLEVLQYKKSIGEKTGGYVPFGYDVVTTSGRKLLTPNTEEQVTLSTIKQLRTQGYSLHAIARHLNEQGIQTKLGKTWRAMQVKRALTF